MTDPNSIETIYEAINNVALLICIGFSSLFIMIFLMTAILRRVISEAWKK